MTTQQTLPERLVDAIKRLVAAHEEFVREVEELTALGHTIQGQIDRLVAKRERKLAEIGLADPRPVQLPRAVMPREKVEETGAA